MKLSVASLGRATRKIVARIQKVRKAAERVETSKRRFAAYRYLRSVYSTYRYFEDNDLLRHLTEIAPSVLKVPVRKDTCALRLIVEASCTFSDLKSRSRWARALRYAVADNVEPKDLVRFIKAHGGIAGCA